MARVKRKSHSPDGMGVPMGFLRDKYFPAEDVASVISEPGRKSTHANAVKWRFLSCWGAGGSIHRAWKATGEDPEV